MEKSDIIQLFFSRQLSAQDWRTFLNQWRQDPEFRSAVLDAKVVYDGLDALRAEQLKQKLKDWKPDVPGAPDQAFNSPDNSMSESLSTFFSASDNDFTEHIEDYQSIIDGFEALRYQHWRDKVSSWGQEDSIMGQQSNGKDKAPIREVFWRQRKWQVAASIAIILSIGSWWLLQGTTEPDPDLLSFMEEAYIEPNTSALDRGGATNIFREAQREYDLKNWEAALATLQFIPDSSNLYPEALYLKGHALYEKQDYKSSQETLHELLEVLESKLYPSNKVNRDNAGWTQILAKGQYFAVDELSEEEKLLLLSDIKNFLLQASPNDVYYQKASDLRALLL